MMRFPFSHSRAVRLGVRRRGGALLGVVLVAATIPTSAWTPKTRAQMIREAASVMPESLRLLMEHHDRELLAGMHHPGSNEDHPEHWQHPDGVYGTAAERADQEARQLIAAVQAHERFSEVIRRFGVLAHWAADVNNPLHAANRDSRLAGYYADYQRYVEGQLPRFPVVFNGYRSETLTSAGPRSYLLESAARAHRYAEPIRNSYLPDGRRSSPEAFDGRSLAFGVGSLSYSNAINDIIRLWIWAWENSHGDLTGTPYALEQEPAP